MRRLVYGAAGLAIAALWVAASLHTEPDSTLTKLWRAEKAFAAADPQHRFTCEGQRLAGFSRAQWFSHAQMRSGQYLVTLDCAAAGFQIVAARQPPDGHVYSIDAAGVVVHRP